MHGQELACAARECPERTRFEADLTVLREGVVLENARVVPPGAGTSRSSLPALVLAASPPCLRPGQPSIQPTLASATRVNGVTNGVHGIALVQQSVGSVGE